MRVAGRAVAWVVRWFEVIVSSRLSLRDLIRNPYNAQQARSSMDPGSSGMTANQGGTGVNQGGEFRRAAHRRERCAVV
jgi:hypothetical protein